MYIIIMIVLKQYFQIIIKRNFYEHNLINYIFSYIGTSILSFIFYKIEAKYYKNPENNSKEQNKQQLDNKELLDDIIYIQPPRKIVNFSKNIFYYFYFIIFLWIIIEQLIEIFVVLLKDLYYWALEIIITSLLNSKLFHLEIYKHHILVYYFYMISIILKLFPIILSFLDIGNQNYIINDTIYYEYCYNYNDINCENVNKVTET